MKHHPLSILCLDAPTTTDGVMMYMPAGRHAITPSQSGKALRLDVLIDPVGAAAIERQRAALSAKAGSKPFFDFGHEDKEASFWPTEFFWSQSPAPGIYARGEWSDIGKAAIEGKRYRQFSPVFYVDDVKAKPSHLVCNENALPNMGGLVNRPAFRAIDPFFAAEAGAHDLARAREFRSIAADARALAAEVRTLLPT